MITKYRNMADREIYMELYQFFLRSQNTVDEQTMAQLQKKLEDAIECGFDLNYTPSNSFISLYELALIHNPQFAIAMLDGWLDIDSKTSDEKSLFLQTAKYTNDVTVFEKALSQTKEINFIEPARTPVTSVVFAGILGALYFQELHAKMVAGGSYLLV